ncbi:hypothetical protein Ngar_c10720 [Candidatus Nitrososphaera gargensis Ga9.2]|uniref:Uncharacterized protein n=1 Tax=Nitrososphaera gargensis (strain Ga9.2) TaxID=1237085 RepID=K0IMM1_NITGG|nr:hypothetical protein [Candidatus Nitrososphaera gargensis]AFU58014.1 hypothetical protein Ngar_c10720 [Candidatus Nitrososphaera gargensis Ga9.2]
MNVIETELVLPSFALAFLGKGGSDDTTATTREEAKNRIRDTIEEGVKQMLE